MPACDEWNLYSLSFDDFSLNEDQMILASVSMFLELGLVNKFNIEVEVNFYLHCNDFITYFSKKKKIIKVKFGNV